MAVDPLIKLSAILSLSCRVHHWLIESTLVYIQLEPKYTISSTNITVPSAGVSVQPNHYSLLRTVAVPMSADESKSRRGEGGAGSGGGRGGRGGRGRPAKRGGDTEEGAHVGVIVGASAAALPLIGDVSRRGRIMSPSGV